MKTTIILTIGFLLGGIIISFIDRKTDNKIEGYLNLHTASNGVIQIPITREHLPRLTNSSINIIGINLSKRGD